MSTKEYEPFGKDKTSPYRPHPDDISLSDDEEPLPPADERNNPRTSNWVDDVGQPDPVEPVEPVGSVAPSPSPSPYSDTSSEPTEDNASQSSSLLSSSRPGSPSNRGRIVHMGQELSEDLSDEESIPTPSSHGSVSPLSSGSSDDS